MRSEMKSKLIITLLVTFFIGIGKAQTTAEAYLALLPPVPGKPCELSTDDINSFTNKMEALIRKIETEIDKRENALNSLVEKKQKKDAAEKRKKSDMTEEDLENLEKMSQAEIMEMMTQPERIEKSKDKKSMISKESMDKRMKEFEKAQKIFQSGEDFESSYKKFQSKYNDLRINYESDLKQQNKEFEAFAISLGPINDGEGSTPADHAKMRQLIEKIRKLGKKLCSDYTTLYESILEEFRSDIERKIPNIRYIEEIQMRDEGLENKDIEPLKAVKTFFRGYIFLADYFFNLDKVVPNWRLWQ